MKLKEYLKQFQGLDPEIEVYQGCRTHSNYVSDLKKFQVQKCYMSNITPGFVSDEEIHDDCREVLVIDFQYK